MATRERPVQGAIVLAAGTGRRFWPYSVVRQKAAFPIANVPAVRRIVESLASLGISRIAVVVGEGEPSVRAALRGTSAQIVYVSQPHPEGTAAAAILGARVLDGDVMVVAGDVVTSRDNLSALLVRYAQERPLAAALIQPLGDELPQSWTTAFHDGERLVGVEGHGREGTHRLCAAYVLNRAALEYLVDNPGIMTRVPVGGMPPREAEIAQSLQMMIDEGQSVLAVEAVGYHVDMDKPWHILEATHLVIAEQSAALQGNVIPASAQIHDGAEIGGRVVLGDGAVIGNRVVTRGDVWLAPGAHLENGAMLLGPVVVGTGTTVRDYSQIGGYSTLGARGVYGHGAEFSGVALDTVYCYHYCEVWGVVGQAADLGAATVCGNLRFDDSDTAWKVQGRVEVPPHAANAAYLGDFCRTGVNAILMPGRRVGVYACVGPGVVVYEDIPDRQLVLLKQELQTRSWGPERYGW